MGTRSNLELMWTVFTKPEDAGMVINDQLASLLVAKLCQPQKTFVDVGAHIGSVISSVYNHDRSISVIAVEASPDKSEKLLRKFPKIELHQCAVGDRDGEVTFFVNTDQSGYNTLGKPENFDADKYIEITVPIRRLDDLVLSENIDVIKIDVEGAELGVIRGGEQVISKNRPVIMFESGPQKEDCLGFSKEAMWSWFNERNFEILIPIRVAHTGTGLTKEGFVESHFYPRRTTNYFAVPVERRNEIRERTRRILNLM